MVQAPYLIVAPGLSGCLIALGGRASTPSPLQAWLWSGDAARQSVLAAAQSYVTQNHTQPADIVAQIGPLDGQITALQYPIGWYDSNDKRREWSWQFVLGALITAIAISMGSTFWFDALQSLVKLRGAGPKPDQL